MVLVVRNEITTIKAAAYKLLGIELVISVVTALLLLVFYGDVPAYSGFLGGLAFILPNAYFVQYAFREKGPETPHAIVIKFYVGEAGKFILTAVIFALCFVLVEPLNVIALFVMYVLMYIINLAGLGLNNKVLIKYTGKQ